MSYSNFLVLFAIVSIVVVFSMIAYWVIDLISDRRKINRYIKNSRAYKNDLYADVYEMQREEKEND